METKHNYDELRAPDPFYPKAKYRNLDKKELGDIVSPGLPRIAINEETGIPSKKVDRHPYVSRVVLDADAEKSLVGEWVNSPAELE